MSDITTHAKYSADVGIRLHGHVRAVSRGGTSFQNVTLWLTSSGSTREMAKERLESALQMIVDECARMGITASEVGE